MRRQGEQPFGGERSLSTESRTGFCSLLSPGGTNPRPLILLLAFSSQLAATSPSEFCTGLSVFCSLPSFPKLNLAKSAAWFSSRSGARFAGKIVAVDAGFSNSSQWRSKRSHVQETRMRVFSRFVQLSAVVLV